MSRRQQSSSRHRPPIIAAIGALGVASFVLTGCATFAPSSNPSEHANQSHSAAPTPSKARSQPTEAPVAAPSELTFAAGSTLTDASAPGWSMSYAGLEKAGWSMDNEQSDTANGVYAFTNTTADAFVFLRQIQGEEVRGTDDAALTRALFAQLKIPGTQSTLRVPLSDALGGHAEFLTTQTVVDGSAGATAARVFGKPGIAMAIVLDAPSTAEAQTLLKSVIDNVSIAGTTTATK